MGLLDKAKSAMKKADSKLGEEVDVGKYKLKISEEKSTIKEKKSQIGELTYNAISIGGDVKNDEVMKLVKEIDEAKAKIEEYEKLIEESKTAGKEERSSM